MSNEIIDYEELKLFKEDEELTKERLDKIQSFLLKKGLTQEQIDVVLGTSGKKTPGYLWNNLKDKHKDKKLKEPKIKEDKEKEDKNKTR